MEPDTSGRHLAAPGFFSLSMVRILASAWIIAAGFGLLTAYFFRNISSQMLDLRKQELVRIVDLGLAAVEPFRDRLLMEESYLSMEQVRRDAAITLRDLTNRHQLEDNYVFMITYDGLVLVNPFAREEEYTNQLERRDVNGTYYIQEMVSTAQIQDGAGFVEYHSARPGLQDPERTIVYVTAIPEWDVFIGAGIYLGEVERENRVFYLLSLLFLLLLLVSILIVVYLTLRPTLRGYLVLNNLFRVASQDPDSNPEVPVDSFPEGSEPWQLLSGFKQMQDRKQEYKQAFLQATVAERVRLARDLYDAVSQTLFSAG